MVKSYLLVDYARIKTNAEPISKLPFNWREGLPTRGWKIFSEEAQPGGRRSVAVQADNGRLRYQQHARHGSGQGPAPKEGGQKTLSEAQLAEALALVNRLWATDPVFRDAHRTNTIHLVTLVLADGDCFKAFSSCDPQDEIHQFNQLLWGWTVKENEKTA